MVCIIINGDELGYCFHELDGLCQRKSGEFLSLWAVEGKNDVFLRNSRINELLGYFLVGAVPL